MLLELTRVRERARTRDRLPRKAARARSPVVIVGAAAAEMIYFVMDPAIECLAVAHIHVFIASTCALTAETVLALG